MTRNSQRARLASMRLYEEESSVDVIAGRYDLDASDVVDFSLNVNPLGSPPAAIAAARACDWHPNLCVLRTFSKYFGLAGLRIGYAVADPKLLRVADVGRPPFNMATAAVHAATAALADETFLPSCKAVFTKETDHFHERLSSSTIAIRGGNANMLLLDLGDRNAAETTAALARKVVVADAASFHGLEQPNMLRVSPRSREDNLKLIAAVGSI